MESNMAVVVKQEPNIDTCCTKIKERPQMKAESDDLETKLVISSCEMCRTPITPRIADPKVCPPIKIKTEHLSPHTNCHNLNIKKEHASPLKVKRSLSIDSLNSPSPNHKRKILYSQQVFKRSNSRSSTLNERFKCSPSPTPSQGSFQSQTSFKRTNSPWPNRNWFNPHRRFDRHLHRKHRPFIYHPFRHHHHQFMNLNGRPNSRQFYDVPKPKLEKDLFVLRIASPMSSNNYVSRIPRPDKRILSNSNGPNKDVNKENQNNPAGISCNLNLIEVPVTVHDPPSNLMDIEEDTRSPIGSDHEDDLRVVDSWDLNENSNGSSSDVAISSSIVELDHDANTEDNSNQMSCNNNIPETELSKNDVIIESDSLENVQNLVDETAVSSQAEKMVASPQSEETVASPKADESVASPQADESVASPQANETVESLQANETVESPQAEETVASPKADESVASPQADESVASPQADETVKSPQADETVESPQADGTVASPQAEETAVTLLGKETVTVSISDEIEVVKQVEKDSEVECVLNKCKEVHICTDCFAERRRIKRNKEVIFVKKIASKGDRSKIPLINLEAD